MLSNPFSSLDSWSFVALVTSAHLLFPHILVSHGTTQRHNAADGCHEPKEVAGIELGGGIGSRSQHHEPPPPLVSHTNYCGFPIGLTEPQWCCDLFLGVTHHIRLKQHCPPPHLAPVNISRLDPDL